MKSRLLALAWIIGAMSACVTPKVLMDTKATNVEITSEEPQPKPAPRPKKDFHQLVQASIPITHEFGSGELKADIFRPHKKALPKTVVIMVPGSGNVSRRGESSGDGVDSYPVPIDVNVLWAKALSDRGFFVLSYDKRTCNTKVNPICNTNDQRDVDQRGISALSRDLDQVYDFALANLDAKSGDVRLVLMSTTQGAQTIALSRSLKNTHGVVLLSPIIGDLETMWVLGLTKAAEQAKWEGQKNQFLNRKESMAGFFTSLKKGDFPEMANVKGATVRFWLSWIDASKNTLGKFKETDRPIFMLFNENDVYSQLNHIKAQGNSHHTIKVKTYSEGDRNFVTPQGIPEHALNDVVAFIEGLQGVVPTVTP
jgi:hypothetical protein